ncbi:MAG: hypothetical protein GY847_05515 [Proteobacteria bacterium]|nr:hypothetical protein [Pseudomonadota bacterium]
MVANTDSIPAEEEKYERAEKKINKEYRKSNQALVTIGEFLFKEFFDCDEEQYRSKSPKKGLSLRKLASRDTVDMTFTQISRSVNLAIQEQILGEVAESKHLTATHRIELLKVKDVEKKNDYAEQVVAGKLTTRQISKLIRNDGYSKKRGESVSPEKFMERALKSVKGIDSDSVMSLDTDERNALVSQVKSLREALDGILKGIAQRSRQKALPVPVDGDLAGATLQ